MRGISLDEIAEATKIGTRSLQALESEEFDKLPGGIFNKGFVRAYAKFLGIDEEQAVSDYMDAVGENHEAGEETSVETLKAVAAAKEAAAAAEGRSGGSAISSIMIAALALLLIAGAGIAWNYLRDRSAADLPESARQPEPVPVRPQAQPPAAASITPPAASSTAAAQKPAPAPPTKASAAADKPAPEFELLIHAREDSWMSITADGKEVMSGTLKAASERAVRARNRVVLKIGNAGGIEISQNGKPLAPLGEPGKTRTVTITAGGVQQ